MGFKNFRKNLNETGIPGINAQTTLRDPPMLLMLKRMGIRNFLGGQRVVVYSNPQLKIEIAIPYDYKNGKLIPSTQMQVKENYQELYEITPPPKVKGVSRYGNNSIYVQMRNKMIGKSVKPKNINDFADWYEHMEKKHNGEVQFKIHNAGNVTSAYAGGKPVGSYHHDKRIGIVGEEFLYETPMHRINTILKNGKEDSVLFLNGASARVHPVTAKAIHDLWHKVNNTNKNKLSELVNSSPEGLVKVAKFADSLLNKNRG